MCQCTPAIRTPYCGKLNCKWPDKEDTNMKVYEFTFFTFDKNNEIEIQAKFTTKPLSARAAVKLIKEDIKKHQSMNKPFCYKIEQDGNLLGLKDIK